MNYWFGAIFVFLALVIASSIITIAPFGGPVIAALFAAMAVSSWRLIPWWLAF